MEFTLKTENLCALSWIMNEICPISNSSSKNFEKPMKFIFVRRAWKGLQNLGYNLCESLFWCQGSKTVTRKNRFLATVPHFGFLLWWRRLHQTLEAVTASTTYKNVVTARSPSHHLRTKEFCFRKKELFWKTTDKLIWEGLLLFGRYWKKYKSTHARVKLHMFFHFSLGQGGRLDALHKKIGSLTACSLLRLLLRNRIPHWTTRDAKMLLSNSSVK